MLFRARVVPLLLALVLIVAAIPAGAAAQTNDQAPTWVDTMDSVDTGLLTEDSPDEARFSYFYDQGQYWMQAHETDFTGDLYSFLTLGELTDTRVAVDFAIENDQPGKYAFVGCRAGETDFGYAFEVHPSSGLARLWALVEGDFRILAETNAPELLAPGFVFNTIEIECFQNLISGAINGEVVLAEFDESFTSGFSHVGIGILNSNPSDISVTFDNLSVIDFNAPEPAPADTGQTASGGQLQPGIEGALAWAAQNPPTAGPLTASAEVFDGNLKSLSADVSVSAFYAELGFTSPEGVPPGLWTVGLCFWLDQDGNCLEMVVAYNGQSTLWILGDVGVGGEYQVIESGNALGVDLTPGAQNLIGLFVDGQTATLTINSENPVATVALPRSGTGDIAAQLSFNADQDGESRSFIMETNGFAVWDLTAATAPATAPTAEAQPTVGVQPTAVVQPTVATQPTIPASTGALVFDQLKAQALSQPPVAGPLTSTLIQSTVTFPWAPAGVNLADLYASATFVNPADTSVPWDIGLAIRYTDQNTDARIIIESTGNWHLAFGNAPVSVSGQLTSFAVTPGATNTLEVVARGATGAFALNGLVIAELDLSLSPMSGDVFASSGFFNSGVLEGRQVTVQDFSVWALSAPGVVATQSSLQPTVAATSASGDPGAVFAERKSAALSQPPVAGPLSGVLTQSQSTFPSALAQLSLSNFYVTATFLNPSDLTVPWNFGIGLRYSEQNTELRFIVDSSGAWSYATGGAQMNAGGAVANVNSASGGANTIEAIADGTMAYLVVNGQLVTTFDLSANAALGDIFIGTGFAGFGIIEGRQIPYQEFSVWSLDQQTAVPTPTQAALVPTAASGQDISILFPQARDAAIANPSVAGPTQGTIVQQAGLLQQTSAGVSLADLYVTATFQNPADGSLGWDIGIGIRQQPDFSGARVIVTAAGNWYLGFGPEPPVASGVVTNLDVQAGGSNIIEILATGASGYLAVNGVPVTALDLSPMLLAGDVIVGSGFFADSSVSGRAIAFTNFQIWPASTGAPDLNPTSAAGSAGSTLAGPFAGVLTEATGTIDFAPAGVQVADFSASAAFGVPADLSVPFSIAMGFRHTGGNDQLRLVIVSDGRWFLTVGNSPNIASGQLNNLVVTPGGVNTLMLSAQGISGTASLNGQAFATLDLSSWSSPGDIWIAAGLISETTLTGRVTQYRDFSVMSLE
ncbi:MAG: hypothetical protein AB7V46_12925 [Thermomicrobiales bacterium]